jgi:hypothetical protein
VNNVYICHSLSVTVSLKLPALVLSDAPTILFQYRHWWRHIVKSPCTNKSVAGKSYAWKECITRCDRFWLPCLREEHAVSRDEPNLSRQPLLDPTQQNKKESKHALGSLRRDAVEVVFMEVDGADVAINYKLGSYVG